MRKIMNETLNFAKFAGQTRKPSCWQKTLCFIQRRQHMRTTARSRTQHPRGITVESQSGHPHPLVVSFLNGRRQRTP